MNHTPPIQDLPLEPGTWKEVMDDPMNRFLKHKLDFRGQLYVPVVNRDKECLWSA